VLIYACSCCRGQLFRSKEPSNHTQGSVCYNKFMSRTLRLFFGLLVRIVCSHRNLLLENLVLRQHLAILKQRHTQPRFATPDKLFWVMLRRLWPRWKQALILVQPETIVRWHRAGFKLNLMWLSRHRSRAGRRCVYKNLRELIFRMVAENPTWEHRAFTVS